MGREKEQGSTAEVFPVFKKKTHSIPVTLH